MVLGENATMNRSSSLPSSAGEAVAASTLALQDRGSFFTTLSEVRARADRVVVFACQPSVRYPRFYERAFEGGGQARAFSFVGCDVDPAASGIAQASVDSMLPGVDPYDVLALWSALVEGRSVDALRD